MSSLWPSLVLLVVCLISLVSVTTLHAQVNTKPVDYSITTIIGTSGDGAKALNVGIYDGRGLVADNRNGNIYYADGLNSQVRYFDTNGISHLFAGSPAYQYGSPSDSLGFANDSLSLPYGAALNSKGDVFIVDSSQNRVKKVFYNSTINAFNMITVAGGGSSLASGIPALSATFTAPRCIAVSPDDEVYVCDAFNYLIKKIVNDTIYNVIGTGIKGNSVDGTLANNTKISSPSSIAFHPITKELFYSDLLANVIRYIARNGSVYTYASITSPRTIVFNSNGDMYVSISTANQIIKVVNGIATVIANSLSTNGFSGDGGNAISASLSFPFGLAIYNNSLYISDSSNYRIRKIDLTSNIISTVAGDGSKQYSARYPGYILDVPLASPLSTFYNSQTDELLMVDNNRVLRLNSLTNYKNSLIESIAGNGVLAVDVDGKLGNQTSLNSACSVFQSEATGDIYIGTVGSVLKLSKSNQLVSTIAGTISKYTGDGSSAIQAQLNGPTGVAISPNGEVYISDSSNDVIRKIDTNGAISTVVGSSSGFLDASARRAQLANPMGIAFLPNGDLIISDAKNNRIRKFSISSGNVTTIAGTGLTTYNGEGLVGVATNINYPTGICVNSSNSEIFFAGLFYYSIILTLFHRYLQLQN